MAVSSNSIHGRMLDQLIGKINSLPRRQKTLLIAIDGRGGSGKSTLAEKLKDKLSNTTIVHLDDFYLPELKGGHRQRLLEQVITPLKRDETANYQRWDWGEKKLAEWHKIEPGGIVIIEGVGLHHDDLKGSFDFSVWIECPAEEGLKRGLDRDRNFHGVDTESDWLNIWLPEEQEYVEEQKPQEKADMVINCEEPAD